MNSFKLLWLLAFYACNSLACFTPKPGHGYSYENLVDSSSVIVLVEVSNQRVEHDVLTFYTLKVVETLKGEPPKEYEFLSFNQEYALTTFSDHTDEQFWSSDTGRSSFVGGCGPNHIFEKGYRYLYFPDLLGAHKSAEMIKVKSDKWLKYVKARIE